MRRTSSELWNWKGVFQSGSKIFKIFQHLQSGKIVFLRFPIKGSSDRICINAKYDLKDDQLNLWIFFEGDFPRRLWRGWPPQWHRSDQTWSRGRVRRTNVSTFKLFKVRENPFVGPVCLPWGDKGEDYLRWVQRCCFLFNLVLVPMLQMFCEIRTKIIQDNPRYPKTIQDNPR